MRGRNSDGEVTPVDELVNLCHSPLFTFFYIMPNSLWVMIDVDMKRYNFQQFHRHAQFMQTRAIARESQSPKSTGS
ncbi:Hypothetical protein PHPALM_5994 [Phytophthora palmivora]|uniref:Uncharacterized protein n=1 Tax=Phytophthora palmivora TaxID=4796 RepID=A0A2P4YFY6_9STRA|nr:Hypothetical protein PHPALM_5994 [Phytophthora palmivora]